MQMLNNTKIQFCCRLTPVLATTNTCIMFFLSSLARNWVCLHSTHFLREMSWQGCPHTYLLHYTLQLCHSLQKTTILRSCSVPTQSLRTSFGVLFTSICTARCINQSSPFYRQHCSICTRGLRTQMGQTCTILLSGGPFLATSLR